MTRYSAPWDRGLRASTAAVVVLLATACLGAVALAGWAADGRFAAGIAAVFVPALSGTLWLVRALAPRGFTVDANAIRVQRTLGDVVIPISGVWSIGPFPGPLGFAAMLVGPGGGVFSYSGSFWNRALGAYFVHATRRTDLVLIDTDRERFLLSPEPPGPFIEEVLSLSPGARRREIPAPDGRRRVPGRVWRRVAFEVTAALVVTAAAFGGLWAHAPRAVSVEETAIAVHRRWASPLELPLREVERVAQVAGPPSRTWGVPGFAWVWFRSEEIGKSRLYGWRPRNFVLLETRSGRIVVTPDDPARFVEDVRARLSR